MSPLPSRSDMSILRTAGTSEMQGYGWGPIQNTDRTAPFDIEAALLAPGINVGRGQSFPMNRLDGTTHRCTCKRTLVSRSWTCCPTPTHTKKIQYNTLASAPYPPRRLCDPLNSPCITHLLTRFPNEYHSAASPGLDLSKASPDLCEYSVPMASFLDSKYSPLNFFYFTAPCPYQKHGWSGKQAGGRPPCLCGSRAIADRAV